MDLTEIVTAVDEVRNHLKHNVDTRGDPEIDDDIRKAIKGLDDLAGKLEIQQVIQDLSV